MLKSAQAVIRFSWRQKSTSVKDISRGPLPRWRFENTCYVLPLQALISVFIRPLCNLFSFMSRLTKARRVWWFNTCVPFTCLVKSSKLSYVQRSWCLWHPIAINGRVLLIPIYNLHFLLSPFSFRRKDLFEIYLVQSESICIKEHVQCVCSGVTGITCSLFQLKGSCYSVPPFFEHSKVHDC